MTFPDLMQHGGAWLQGGPMGDVVISSRVRLARNLAGMPFLSKCTHQQLKDMEARLRDEILPAGISRKVFYVDIAAAGKAERELLVERHLISRQHADAEHPRGLAVSEGESIAIMVNEEDHLRIQVLRSGLQVCEALTEINQIDDTLAERLDFAFHSRYGYLTACPTNVGTGLRVSVMLHLPALSMARELDKAFRAAQDMHLAVRGLYGEGTEYVGDLFQVSNQTTLGKSEEEIAEDFGKELIPKFIEYERRARQVLMRQQSTALDDKVYRAFSILSSARLISSKETLYLLSLLRLGINADRIKDVGVETINELFLMTQPAHLQRMLNRELSSKQRDQARAEYVRRRLSSN